MASPLDFNAVLGAQLRDAAAQMRTMRTPPNAPKPAPEEKDASAPSPASPAASAAPFSENEEAQRTPASEAGTSPGTFPDMKADAPKGQPRKTSATEENSAPEASSGPVASASPTATEHNKAALSATASLTAVETTDATVTKFATPPVTAAVTGTANKADTKGQSSQPGASAGTAASRSPATAKPATKNTAPHAEKGPTDHDRARASAVPPTVTGTASATVFVTANDTTKTEGNATAGAGAQESAGKGNQFSPAVKSTLQSSGLEAYAELRGEEAELPLLSEKSWSGGVRGAVLDALRQLAGGKDHVLVNLKRLASHAGLSYGSVRNAMSRLVRSGDIRSRQIRVADGHGVRVEFLTSPGAEGTGTAPHFAPATLAAGDMSGHMAGSAPRGAEVFPQRGMPVSETAYPPVGQTVAMTVAQQVQTPPVPSMPHVAHAFWQTDDTLFALAWPQAAAAGLSMEKLRKLDPVFAVQGFDPGILPRCLRYLDFELEQMAAQGLSSEEQAEKARLFVECLQRRGSWPRPEGYEEA